MQKVHNISPVQQGVKPKREDTIITRKSRAQQNQDESVKSHWEGHECKLQIRYAKKIMIRKKNFSPCCPVLKFSEENETLP
jgi:hypothetical protein